MKSQKVKSLREVADTAAVEDLPPASIVNCLGAIVILLDGEGRITWVNNRWSVTTGIPLDDVLDKPLLDFVAGQSEKRRVDGCLNSVGRQQRSVDFDCSVTCRAGTDQRIKWSFTVTQSDADGGPLLTGAGVEVTDLYNEVVKLKKELAQASTNSGGQTKIAVEEKRRCDRVPFTQVVHIAPVVDGKLPPVDAFQPVRCRDLSQAGFSFFLPDRPEFSELVVVFAEEPRRCVLHAKIAHVTPTEVNENRLFFVGCEFKTRLDDYYHDTEDGAPEVG